MQLLQLGLLFLILGNVTTGFVSFIATAFSVFYIVAWLIIDWGKH
jgi:hypothetical protein